MAAPTVADPPRALVQLFGFSEVESPHQWVDWRPFGQDLSEIERHVLGRIALHEWTHGGRVPFSAPNAHQRAVAFRLAAPTRGLVSAASWSARRTTFRLTDRGEVVTRAALRVVAAGPNHGWEVEFDRMQALMRNDWETDVVDDKADPPRLLL